MQEYKPRFMLVRRILLPYTGRDPLTHAQARHLILSWFVFFALLLSLGSLPVVAAFTSSVVLLVIVFLLTFFCGGAIFALMAGFVVYSINRTALYQQKMVKVEARPMGEARQMAGSRSTVTVTEQDQRR